jgi:hypothetical protein
MVGQWVNDYDSVFSRFNDLTEVTDCPVGYSRRVTVMPDCLALQ